MKKPACFVHITVVWKRESQFSSTQLATERILCSVAETNPDTAPVVTDCDYEVFNIHANGRRKPAVTAGRPQPSKYNNLPESVVSWLPPQVLSGVGSLHRS